MVEARSPIAEGQQHESRREWFGTAPPWRLAMGCEAAPHLEASFQFGEGILQIASDHPAFIERLQQLFGDCAVAPAIFTKRPLVRCVLSCASDPSRIVLAFQVGKPEDALATMLNLLYPPPGTVPYVIKDGPLPGRRHISGGADPARPVVIAQDAELLIDPQLVPMDLLADYLVSATLAAQPHLLVVHGASLRIGSAGIILSGYSFAGKTTTALHVAARGHALLGDEFAVIHCATGELLPLPRAMSIRPGPRGGALVDALEPFTGEMDSTAAANWTARMRISALFPKSARRPARLRAAFFLGGFADRPSVTPCHPTLRDGEVFRYLASDMLNSSWGLAPERRVLRLLALKAMLARIECWELTLGAPDETAELIETTMGG